MKKLTFLLFLFGSLSINAQESIPKRANLISIESERLSNIDLFKACVELLKEKGYPFNFIDKDFYILSTRPQKFDKTKIEYMIDLTVTENKIQIRSYVRSLTSFSNYSDGTATDNLNSWERGSYRKIKSSLWMHGWNKQSELAQLIMDKVGGKPTYTTEVRD